MASTPSTSLRLELMATGDQSGTWGDTTNTNLGTLLEQAITGNIQIAKVGTGDYTLSNTDYISNENRNYLIEFTGTPGGAFNVIVPNAKKLWVFKNSTPSAMTIKTSGGTTTVTVSASSSRWVYCDGSAHIYDVLTGTLATQSAANVAITGGTITGISSLTTTGAATPATNDAAALGSGSLGWSDLFLAAGGIVDFGNGDVTITSGTNSLAFGGASNGYTVDAVFMPATNDGAALGTGTSSFSDLFLASGGVIDFANNDVRITHSTNLLAFTGASSGYTFDVPIGLASGGTGASLTDPNADRIMFWDDSAGQVTWLTAGTGLTITDTTLAVSVSSPISNAVTNNTATNTQTFNASGTWTKPAAGNYAIVYAWGGGSNGAENTNGNSNRAGGSGGGSSITLIPMASLSATETVTVGAGSVRNNAPGVTTFGTKAFAGAAGRSAGGGNASIQSGGGGGSWSSGTAAVGNTGNSFGDFGVGGTGENTLIPSIPMSAAALTQTNAVGLMGLVSAFGGRGADGVARTLNINAADGKDASFGGGSGGAGTGVTNNGGNSIYGGGGASGGVSSATLGISGGQSTYGGRGGFGTTATNMPGVQPGGGGMFSANDTLNVGGAGKVIVYVY